MNMKDNLALQN